MSVYQSLGLNPIINATGTVTRLGGAAMPDTVLSAYQEASKYWVPLEELQAAASRVISQVTGTDAGIITAGASASLTLGTAAMLAGLDLAKMESLPSPSGANEILMAREHRNGYDHAVRAAGARIVEVGCDEVRAGAGVRRTEVWEYESKISESTAGVVYVYHAQSRPALDELTRMCHSRGVPVLVDAAGELPPRSNLLLGQMTGANLTAFSGGKAIRGPQSSGILCGTRDLVMSAALQMLDMDEHYELWDPPPDLFDKQRIPALPRHGIGRSMKVSKEEIVALITALIMFSKGEFDALLQLQNSCLQEISQRIPNIPHRLLESEDGESPPILEIDVSEDHSCSALELCRMLRKQDPAIYVSTGKVHEGILVVNPVCLSISEAQTVGSCLASLLGQ